ncbi:beta-propeller fold lactonase family protein [Isoptericola sp. BMS4]|uniref:lactonase family protein n=1 Tax=Isoptericola sp. BMS4 TaxID=2527875 RepID=UPI00141EA4EC|nr:beta-propeller fold lactonase family protein [Isoptericola sp. BMS4]
MTESTSRALWIGTYPAPGAAAGSGEGIWSVDVDRADGRVRGGRLAAAAAAPSFLALHPGGRTLYAVSETPAGSLLAFDVEGEPGTDAKLVPAGAVPSGGDAPCHVLAGGAEVWVANYGDGVAAAASVDAGSGRLAAGAPRTFAGSGSGPVAARQGGPHAHFVADVDGQVLVSDLGADVLRRYADGGDAGVAATLPPGTGPRHLVRLPDGSLVVVGELDARAHVLVRDGDGWSPASAVPLHPGAEAGTHFAAHVTLSADGTRLHVTVRGSDVLAVHRVRRPDGGAPPVLEHLADVPLGDGGWPRHHAVVASPDDGQDAELVVVALQGTRELATVALDPVTGTGEVTSRYAMPTPPACVLEA